MMTNPIILLCYINTKLRDQYKNFDDLCEDLDLSKEEVINLLRTINYEYDEKLNQFK